MRSNNLERKEMSKLSVLTAWFWFALYMLPVVLFVFNVIEYVKFNGTLLTIGDLDNFVNDYVQFLPFDFFNHVFYQFFDVIGGFESPDWVTTYDLIIHIVSYYGFVKLIHIVVDVLFLIPDLVTDWLERKC